jgi:hypothetical protein
MNLDNMLLDYQLVGIKIKLKIQEGSKHVI